MTRRFLVALGTPDASFEDLLRLDDATLDRASGRLLDEVVDAFPGHQAFQPVVDGDLLTDVPARAVAAGHGSAVPLLTGSTEDEGSVFARRPLPPLVPTSDAAVRRLLRQDHPDVADRVPAA